MTDDAHSPVDAEDLARVLGVSVRTAQRRLRAWRRDGTVAVRVDDATGGRPAYVADPASLRAYLEPA